MPPRHAYWTILIGGAPTAFRAHDRADLEPTFERLRQKQPDVAMKYFARGRLWESPDEARRDTVPPERPDTRGREWRPGGSHRDPRDRFKPKKGKPRFEGQRRERPQDERRGQEHRSPDKSTEQRRPDERSPEQRRPWTPKPKPFAKPAAFGKRQPFAKSGSPRDRKPVGDRKPWSGDRKPHGDRRPWSSDRKPSGDRVNRGRASQTLGHRKPRRRSKALRRPQTVVGRPKAVR